MYHHRSFFFLVIPLHLAQQTVELLRQYLFCYVKSTLNHKKVQDNNNTLILLMYFLVHRRPDMKVCFQMEASVTLLQSRLFNSWNRLILPFTISIKQTQYVTSLCIAPLSIYVATVVRGQN